MRILVVDDDRDTVVSQVLLLQKKGYEAFGCRYGAEVLDTVERRRPEVILLDLSMPDINGYDIAGQLRQRPDLRPRSLVACTGFGQECDRANTAAAGFDYHLLKPVSWDELQVILECSARPLQESRNDHHQ